MANVVLTRFRRDMIVDGAIKHLNAEYTALNQRIDALAQTLASFTYDLLVPADLQLKLKDLPPNFLHWAKGCRVAFANDKGVTHVTDLQFGQNRPLDVMKMSGVAQRFTSAHRGLHPNLETIFQLMDEQSNVVAEREALKQRLTDLMRPCSSLQQLCKVFPTALNLVDDATRAMYNRRVERGSAPDLTGLMTPDLKVALVKSTMIRNAKG